MNQEYKKDVIRDFEIEDGFSGVVIWYEYDNGGWDGEAEGYFVDKGKLYRFGGSHCSCYGLEDQFDPEELTVDDLIAQAERLDGRYDSLYRTGVLETMKILQENNFDLASIEFKGIMSQ